VPGDAGSGGGKARGHRAAGLRRCHDPDRRRPTHQALDGKRLPGPSFQPGVILLPTGGWPPVPIKKAAVLRLFLWADGWRSGWERGGGEAFHELLTSVAPEAPSPVPPSQPRFSALPRFGVAQMGVA